MPAPLPTVITFGPDGHLYALAREGKIMRLEDKDGDGYYETIQYVYDNAGDELVYAVGMAFLGKTIYVSDGGRINTLVDSDDDGQYDTVTTIIQGLPSLEHVFHSNNGIAFGPDGKLYIAVGSTSDHGPLSDPLEASVLRADPDGSNLEVYATGFRNPYDLAFSPQGELFTADNSPDGLDETLHYLPPEELNLVLQGRNYGFPNVFGSLIGDSNTEPPVTEFDTSSATSGLVVYAADQFPPAYHGVYVAQFGTGAAYPVAAGVDSGRMVVLVSLAPVPGGYVGTWRPFARFRADHYAYRPVDVTVGPDGSLYIAEYTTATIFRVTYVGESLPIAANEPGGENSDNSATTVPAGPSAQSATGSLPALLAEGETLFRNGANGAPACITCHMLQAGVPVVGPSLLGISARAGSRTAGLDTQAYVRQSILDPNAYVVSGYQMGLMYSEYGKLLTESQIDALVAYVMSLPASR